MVFQMVLGLVGMGHVFGGPPHISGSVHGHPQLTIAHISGRSYLGNVATVKTHVSGSKKVLPVQELEPVPSKIIRKIRNIGITMEDPEKLTSTQVRKKTTRKTKMITRTIKIVEQASLGDRIKKRKACWKRCENTWKVNVQELCSFLSDLLRPHCKKELFKERLSCVSQNCRETAQ